MTIAIAATFSAELVEDSLNFWLKQLEIEARIEFAPFNQVFQQLLDPASLLATNPNGINVLLVRLEDWVAFDDLRQAVADASLQARLCRAIEQHVQDFVKAQEAAAANCRVPWLVCFCPASDSLHHDRPLASIIEAIESRAISLCRKIPNTYPLSGAELAAMYPIANLYDQLSDELARVPYTPLFFTALGTMIVRRLYALQSLPRKVIVLDCDRTLWAGNCAEDGAEGVGIDEPRRVFQEFLLAQQRAGMLLCLCSRNNEADVLDVFRRHAGMVLKLEHLVAWRINWLPKSRNLQSLANQLGLGLESFIFIDDDPFQCAEVAAACPQVLSLPLPDESREIPGFLAHVWAFDRLKPPSSEDRNRTRYYRSDLERKLYRQQMTSLVDFLAGLRLQVRFEVLAPHHYARISQLTLRTNQFNLTTRRRSESELHQLLHAGPWEGLCVEVTDRFGDYGLVGALIIKAEKEAFEVDTFLLSCRALGRGVEHQMLARLGEAAKERGLKWVNVPCLPTPKNQPGRDFLDSIGAAVRETSGPGFLYRFPATHAANVCYLPAAGPEAELEARESAAHGVGSAEPREIDGLAMESPVADAPSSTISRIARELNSAESILSRIEAQRIQARPNVGAEFVAPGNPLETQLAAIWQEILGCDRVGIHDNFFEMGGHSILMIRLISRIRDALEIELPIRTLFDSPTVAELALIIEKNPHARAKLNISAMLLEKVNLLSNSEVTELLATIQYRQTAAQDEPGGGAGIQGSEVDARESGAEKPDLRGQLPSRKTAGRAPQTGIGGSVWSVSGPDTRMAHAVAAEITTVAIPTRNRPGSLKECLISFLENSRRYARTNEFVIADDSPDPETRDDCRRMLEALRREYGLRILYAGVQEKIRFAHQLTAHGGLPPDIVEFALFDSERVGYTAGANRNAILLHTGGEALFSTDDDTRCRVVAAPEGSDRLQVAVDSSPEQLWIFPDRMAALNSAAAVEKDILAIHEQLLGREMAWLVTSIDTTSRAGSGPAEVQFFDRLAARNSRIRLTMNGLVGDCGWGAPFGFWGQPIGFLLARGTSRDRLVAAESDYRRASTSREILKVVTAPTISIRAPCMTGFLGLDNRDLLPPFMPAGRGQDLAFGVILSHCFNDAYVGHLPYALLHSPPNQRTFSPGEMFRSASGYDLAKLMLDCVALFSDRIGRTDPIADLQALGRSLAELGRVRVEEFARIVHSQAKKTAGAAISELEDSLLTYNNTPGFWAADVNKYIDILRQNVARDDYAIPLDLLTSGRTMGEARLLAQRLVWKFGELLRLWPEMVETARVLRTRNCRLAALV